MNSSETAVFRHNVVLLNVSRTIDRLSLYDAVRYAWKIDINRAARAEYVVAVSDGIIRGVFEAERWLPATPENFPDLADPARPLSGRWGFVGRPAPDAIQALYLGKSVANQYHRGAANPVRYVEV